LRLLLSRTASRAATQARAQRLNASALTSWLDHSCSTTLLYPARASCRTFSSEAIESDEEELLKLASRALQGHGFESRPEVRDLLRDLRIVLVEGEPEVSALAVAFYNHGNLLIQMTRDEASCHAARELFEEGKRAQIATKADRERSPLLARLNVSLAGISVSLGEHSRAVEESQSALDIETKVRGPVHHYVAACWNMLGSAKINTGDFEDGIIAFQTAVDVYKQVLMRWEGDDALPHCIPKEEAHTGFAMALNNLGSALLACQDYEKAKSTLKRCVEEKEALHGRSSPHLIGSLKSYVQVLEALGEEDEMAAVEMWVARINEELLAKIGGTKA